MYMSLVCTRMSSVCYSYVLVRHLYVTRMSSVCHSYVLVCHSYALVCHPYVTRIYLYVIHMSLVCGITMNLFYPWFDAKNMNVFNMMYSLWSNKKKINRIMKKLKFCESFDVYMDSIEFFSI